MTINSESFEGEKRSSFRCPTSANAILRVTNGISSRAHEFPIFVINLSDGGIGFLFNNSKIEKIDSGVIKFNSLTKPSVEVKGRFAWIDNVREPNQFRCGFQFDEVDFQRLLDIRRIAWSNDDFINSYVRAALGTMKLVDDLKDEVFTFFSNEVRNFVRYMVQLNDSSIRKGAYFSAESQRIFDDLCDKSLERGFKIVSEVDSKATIMNIKNLFRNIVGPWVYQGIIVKDAFLKPRGYPGDYRTLERIYDNKVISTGVGVFSEEYFLKNNYAYGVQQRKNHMKEILSLFLNENQIHSAKILNIACGSCREIKELLDEPIRSNREVIFTCVDHDQEALSFVKENIDKGIRKFHFRYIKDNIVNFTKDPKKYFDLFGTQDLIYSIGLIDYLPDRVLKQLLGFLYALVVPNGKLLVTHKDKEIGKFSALAPDWFCDWRFVPRSKNEIHNLIAESGLKDYSIINYNLPSTPILFLEIKKR